MKKIARLRFVDLWQPSILILCSLAICLVLYGIFINSLVSGLSISELEHSTQAFSLRNIISNFVWLPYKLSQYILLKLGLTDAASLRLPSVIIGSVCVFLFYYLVRQWHTTRVSTLTTTLFMTSAWMLHVSRSASPDILLVLAPLALLSSGMYLRNSKPARGMISVALAASLTIYVPFAAPLLIPLGLWQLWGFIANKKKPSWRPLGLATSTFIILSLPLFIGVASSKSVPSEYLFFSQDSVSGYLGNLAMAFIAISYGVSGLNASRWLGKLPLLDIGASLFLTIGLISTIKYRALLRVRLALLLSLYGLLVVALTDDSRFVGLSLAPLYLLVAEGLSYMLSQWFSTFPKNPVARTYGANLVTIVVLLSILYNLNHYFIAWPLSPQTKTMHTSIQRLD